LERSVQIEKPLETDDIKVGRKLRLRRKIKGLSLQDVATGADCSVGQISQIERGLTTPSLKLLRRICDVLETPIQWLFEKADDAAGEDDVVVRLGRRRHLSFPDNKMTKQLMTPDECSELQMMLITIEPGGGSDPDFITMEGSKCGTILEGSLALEVDERTVILEPGDSFGFKATRMHRYWCEGDRPVKIVWIVTPASY
jgi:transcriptional regulator with XRE-family HTH domain